MIKFQTLIGHLTRHQVWQELPMGFDCLTQIMKVLVPGDALSFLWAEGLADTKLRSWGL